MPGEMRPDVWIIGCKKNTKSLSHFCFILFHQSTANVAFYVISTLLFTFRDIRFSFIITCKTYAAVCYCMIFS